MTEMLAMVGGDMLDNLVEAIQASTEHPWVQGWLTAIATFFFENVICWTIVPPLISTEILDRMTAWQATFWGVFIGDILMYIPSRYAMRWVMRMRWMRRNRRNVEAFGSFFGKHLGKTMFIIRFTPGIRTFALIAAGMIGVPFVPYVFWSAVSCALQSSIVVFFMPRLFDPVLAWMNATWAERPLLVIVAIALFLGVFFVFQYVAAKAAMKRATAPKKPHREE